eukprot:PhF_6_TR40636/c0_g1_i2/m.60999
MRRNTTRANTVIRTTMFFSEQFTVSGFAESKAFGISHTVPNEIQRQLSLQQLKLKESGQLGAIIRNHVPPAQNSSPNIVDDQTVFSFLVVTVVVYGTYVVIASLLWVKHTLNKKLIQNALHSDNTKVDPIRNGGSLKPLPTNKKAVKFTQAQLQVWALEDEEFGFVIETKLDLSPKRLGAVFHILEDAGVDHT